MMEQLRELGAKILKDLCTSPHVFSAGDFQKRYTEGEQKGVIQVKTHNGRVVEKKEAFPYGFCAKAKSGKAFVFCQGGNLDGFEIFPVLPGNDITPPELADGDVAVYTGAGGYAVLREAGGVEIHAKGGEKIIITAEDGTLYVGNGSINTCALLIGLIDEIKAIVTSGSPTSQTILPATQQKLETYKNKVKQLYAEGR